MRSKLSGVQIPTAAKLNIDGEFTLDSAAGTSGQLLISQGSGNTPAWTSTPNLLTPLLTRVDSTSEGGQIDFARSSDNTGYWHIDSFGTAGIPAGSTPDLRVIENASERFRFVSGGAISIGGQTGTSGQILVSAGSASAPTWTNTLTSPTIDVINAASASGTTADLFGNVTTGTIGIGDGLTTGTLNLGTGSVTNTSGRTVNINTNASGTMTVTTNIGSSVIGGQINLVAGSSGGVTITGGGLTLAAGTSTPVIPLKFVANSSTPAATAGGMDYDGLFYATGSAAKRGLIPTQHTYSLTGANTLTTTAGTKAAFGVSLSLEANTVYEFELQFGIAMTCSTSSTSSTVALSVALPTSATGSYTSAQSSGTQSSSATMTIATNATTPLANTAITYTGTSTTLNGQYQMKGTVRTAANTGSFTPNVVLVNNSNAPTAFSILAGSYVTVKKIGAANANINIGAWA